MSIKLDHVTYVYSGGTAFERKALDDICLEIPDGQFVGMIGHTGSGKSTLIQHLNGLLQATSGTIYVDGEDIYREGYDRKALRGRVGLVFQYPEHQLFETDVFTDVCFGPKNQGLSDEEIKERAVSALAMVGMDESFYKKSPFELSGGQKRRAAIAGILAMHPRVLILDEPMVGLDPKQIIEIRELIRSLGKKHTVILSSHILSEITSICDHVMIISHGKLVASDTPEKLGQYMKSSDVMELRIRGSAEACEKAKRLLEKAIKGLEIQTTTASLEEVFLELTSEGYGESDGEEAEGEEPEMEEPEADKKEEK